MSDLYIREFNKDTDYPMVDHWWKGYGTSSIPKNMLPKLGILCHDTYGFDICASWLYMDNSIGVCWMSWVVFNPEATDSKLLSGMRTMSEFFKSRAINMGYNIMFADTHNKTLAKIFERNGFSRTNKPLIHLVKAL